MDDTDTSTAGHSAQDAARLTIMIAVENAEGSIAVVREAHRLFGDGVQYFVVNVGESQFSSMRWAAVYPVGVPGAWFPPPMADTAPIEVAHSAEHRAELRAADLAEEASLADATPLGEIGDPAVAIVRAAHDHNADVVVIGAHQHGWFSRIFTTSVERSILREADFAVLVVKHP
jgi:nucleotide-binding universal stress UspA family protein